MVARKYKETIKKLNSQKIPKIINKDGEIVELFCKNKNNKDVNLAFLMSALALEFGLVLFKNIFETFIKNKWAYFQYKIKTERIRSRKNWIRYTLNYLSR